MGLITEEVEIGLVGVNVKRYESLGYDIPRENRIYRESNGKFLREAMAIPKGTKIKVKIEDVSLGSKVKVCVECDCCHKIIQIGYDQYNKCNHNGKYYCKKCANSILLSGKNHWHWNPNLTNEDRKNGRNYPEYIIFTQRVLARDNYTCQCCGKPADVVHHMYAYANYPEYRIDDNFAVSLCENCHQNFHMWHLEKYGFKEKGKNTKEQFEEWYGKNINTPSPFVGELPTCFKVYCFELDKVFKSADEAGNELHLLPSGIRGCCIKSTKTYGGYHFLYEKDYKNMSQDDIDVFFQWAEPDNKTKIVCLNTGQIFDSISDAERHYDIYINHYVAPHTISQGKDENGNKLYWAKLSEYKTMTIEEINAILVQTDPRGKKIICLNNDRVFESSKKAADYYNLSRQNIISNCEHKTYFVKDNANLNYQRVFIYYDEYTSLSNDEVLSYLQYTWPAIICLNDLNIFYAQKIAQQYYDLTDAQTHKITLCCQNKRPTTGINPNTKEKLKWQYFKDYIAQNNIENIKEFIKAHFTGDVLNLL